ncbi:MAG: exosortase A, partial [Gammaproteobacteria bacterium]
MVPAAEWRSRFKLLALAYACVLAAYYGTSADIVRVWYTSSTFNHCFLIVPIALFMIYERRDALTGLRPGVAPWALPFLALNGVLWLAGDLLAVAFFQHVALVGMIVTTTWLLLGTPVTRAILFPLAYLFFCVPEGEFLVPYLQDLTAEVLVTSLRATGMPVLIEGRHLTIPSGQFVVAEACSGINYLLATLAVGAMFAYLRYR